MSLPNKVFTTINLNARIISSNYFDETVEVEVWTDRPFSGLSKFPELKFSFQVDEKDSDFLRSAEQFQQDVVTLDRSVRIKVKNGSVRYSYHRGEAIFILGSVTIILTNTTAPEYLREALSDMFCLDFEVSEDAF